MQSNDQELIDLLGRCQQKDQRAIKVLYDRLAPYLNGVAFRILQSDELSNEVLQEAFVQIWQKADSYEPQLSKPLTWMTSIVRYRAIDKLQKEQRHFQREPLTTQSSLSQGGLSQNGLAGGDNEPENVQIPIHETPDGEYARSQLRGHIVQCLEPMNDKVKRCIELAYLMGYSREELAHEFGTKVNTVKSWLHRGSERLKLCLQNKNQTDLI